MIKNSITILGVLIINLLRKSLKKIISNFFIFLYKVTMCVKQFYFFKKIKTFKTILIAFLSFLIISEAKAVMLFFVKKLTAYKIISEINPNIRLNFQLKNINKIVIDIIINTSKINVKE